MTFCKQVGILDTKNVVKITFTDHIRLRAFCANCPMGAMCFFYQFLLAATERKVMIMGFFDKLFGKKYDEICAPMAGQVVPISEVNDPTFSEEILGKGVAIRPTDGKVYAPCDCTVDMMFETGHAVSLVADHGAEILIHTGLETVGLKGKHYTIYAHSGDKVSKGDLLMEFDLDAVAAEGYDTITPVVVCNSGDYKTFNAHTGKACVPGDLVIALAK